MNDIHTDRRAFLGTFAALGVSGAVLPRSYGADDAKIDPLSLARKVEALYASCKTYRDTCQVNMVIRNGRGEEQGTADTRPRKLTTAFRRPDRLRYEFDSDRGGKVSRYLIWMDGRAVKTWWDIRPGVQTPESLQFALGAAAGVTESSSMTIPPLLLPDLLRRPNALSKGPGVLSMLEDAGIGAHPCHRLRSRFEAVNFRSGKKFEVVDVLWIDAKSSAIRRVVKEMQLDDGRSVGTIDLEPEFDVDIPDSVLAFDPPVAKP